MNSAQKNCPKTAEYSRDIAPLIYSICKCYERPQMNSHHWQWQCYTIYWVLIEYTVV